MRALLASTAQVPQVQLALLLAEGGARGTVVGSTARLLRGEPVRPADLDLAVRRTDLPALLAALARVAPSVPRLRAFERSPVRIPTAWSPADVFAVEDDPASRTVVVDGTALRIAEHRA